MEIEGVVYAPTHDQSGSTAALVNAKTGVIVFSARYSAFGQIEKSQGFSPPYQFSSKRYDPETDWIYFGRRYYDPSLGRWTTCDPKGYSDGFNLYAYVHNNPLIFIDKFGLSGKSLLWNFTMGFGGFMRNNTAAPLGGSFYHSDSTNTLPKVEVDLVFENFFPPDQRSFVHDLNYYGANLPEPGNMRIITMNGINTKPHEQRQFGERISEMSGGYNVHMVYNATHGTFEDLGECWENLTGYTATVPEILLLGMVKDMINEIGDDAAILILGHSHGGIKLRNFGLMLDEKYRKNVIGIGLCPAAYMYEETFSECYHFVSTFRDIVPLIDIPGMVRSWNTIEWLSAHPDAALLDHSCMSPTFFDPIEDRISDIIDRRRLW